MREIREKRGKNVTALSCGKTGDFQRRDLAGRGGNSIVFFRITRGKGDGVN